jgi:small acid-soluble spore protein F (minor alpha/beta-type SASP)
MSKQQSFISESMREEIAKELGIYDKVKANGWGAVSSKECGMIVKKALEKQSQKEDNNTSFK